ncbi:unnamed protein product [Diamesa serratosioi]
MEEASPSTSEKPKKIDELSREELVTKCKNLLVIAKKAKQIKDETIAENKLIKEELNKYEQQKSADKDCLKTMQEMVESLTENKLSAATQIDDLNKKLIHLENHLAKSDEVSTENEGLKRQVQRLSDENDSLLEELEKMETKAKTAITTTTPNDHQSVDENNTDNETDIEKLKIQIVSITKSHDDQAQELKSLQIIQKDMTETHSAKIRKLIQDNSDLKTKMDDAANPDQLQVKYDKLVRKLKLYREKLIEISGKLKVLKSDREVLRATAIEYSEIIPKWQNEIINATKHLISRSIKFEEEVKALKEQINPKDQLILDLEKKMAELNNKSSESDGKRDEAEIERLKNVIKNKDKALSDEMEAQKKLKTELNLSKLAIKKTSVLSLEMDAYEKSLNQLNEKLEAKKLQATELEATIITQQETMTALKNQIRLLEESLNSEKVHGKEMKKSMDQQQNKLRESEHERTDSNIQLELLNKNYESLKLENDEVKVEMSRHISEMDKRCNEMECERNDLQKQVLMLECEADTLKKSLSNNEKEIEDLKLDFANYKIRVHTVLKKNQKEDSSHEQELQEEIITLQKVIDDQNDKFKKLSHQQETLNKNYSELVDDKKRLQNRCKELLDLLEESRLQSEQVLDDSRARNQEHQTSIKTYQLQIETLNTCFKKQIKEIEEKIDQKTLVEELKQDKLNKSEQSLTQTEISHHNPYDYTRYQQKSDEQKISLIMMDREEAEGSEDQNSSHASSSSYQHRQHRRKISSTKGRELMPLDELLNSSFDENYSQIPDEAASINSIPPPPPLTIELEQTKAKLSKEVSRVKHFSALLAESEQDLAKLQQLNEMLKEEVRRQQRNFDREVHIQNAEYLKNVFIKFATLGSGEEKSRLIPVLNTILKLSPDENKQLEAVCKSGWGMLWSK